VRSVPTRSLQPAIFPQLTATSQRSRSCGGAGRSIFQSSMWQSGFARRKTEKQLKRRALSLAGLRRRRSFLYLPPMLSSAGNLLPKQSMRPLMLRGWTRVLSTIPISTSHGGARWLKCGFAAHSKKLRAAPPAFSLPQSSS
jgi:hypothetical protein